MPPDEVRQLASIAAVTDDLDKLLDKLFENVAELKVILARTGPGAPDPAEEKP